MDEESRSILRDLAAKAGFSACFVLRLRRLEAWAAQRDAGKTHPNARLLQADPQAAYPWANAALLLVMPCPLVEGLPLSAYYLASNRSYHAAQALAKKLGEQGIRAEHARVPERALLLENGFGARCDNALLALEPFGTRFVLQSLVLRLPEGEAYDVPAAAASACLHCGRCAAACPTGAIQEDGYDWTRCLRSYMEKAAMPRFVMEKMDTLLGCERCQNVCPLNEGTPVLQADAALRAAFDPERLLAGDDGEAGKYIGKNLLSGKRLTAQAAVLAGKSGQPRYAPLLKKLLLSDNEALRAAADFALTRLREDGATKPEATP